ncbi:MAG: 50S ribosomal protein L25 [Planctomycetes bacterium]|nr:50S ribosomal protein L25 [Planctomycetota bacterium]
MKIPALKAERRAVSGTKAMRKARAEGRMPGVLYGRGKDNQNLLFSSKDIQLLVHDAAHVVKLDMGGEEQYALMRALQRDFLGDEIQHIDFVRIELSDKVRLRIPLTFRGTPKGATHGGMLEVSHGDVEVHCPADRIPKDIEVEVTNLDVGDAIHFGELKLPEGADLVAKPSLVVVKCAHARRAEEDLVPAVGAAAAVPSATGAPAAAAAAAAAPAAGKEAAKGGGKEAKK